MTTRTMKTLGAAALGVAFVAAAAGSASAAALPAVDGLASATSLLGGLPLADAAKTLPVASQITGNNTATPNAQKDPVGGLLGGLPTGGLPTSGLATNSLPTSGLPTSGLLGG
ncbi:hypothetical protein QMK19_10735 [Streptomyces sp. H10-C2]|uniref:hypothetical protein n=1 Tax=unclassified Streptomyces TaxID=2593676 RepID=UPI0024BA4591|nr:MULTISPECIES: hypothetical protein [unclassified Streptomyces]MDJ0340485.1 hypothetical protein [Streptomyces sp. PH10-H1]MDJ0370133.1 hypothetical protein [Streptomyces sp. H10-C2]